MRGGFKHEELIFLVKLIIGITIINNIILAILFKTFLC